MGQPKVRREISSIVSGRSMTVPSTAEATVSSTVPSCLEIDPMTFSSARARQRRWYHRPLWRSLRYRGEVSRARRPAEGVGEDGRRREERSSEFGFVFGDGGDKCAIAAGIVHCCSNNGTQTPTASRHDHEGVAEVSDLYGASIGQVPSSTCFSRQRHLPSV